MIKNNVFLGFPAKIRPSKSFLHALSLSCPGVYELSFQLPCVCMPSREPVSFNRQYICKPVENDHQILKGKIRFGISCENNRLDRRSSQSVCRLTVDQVYNSRLTLRQTKGKGNKNVMIIISEQGKQTWTDTVILCCRVHKFEILTIVSFTIVCFTIVCFTVVCFTIVCFTIVCFF